MLIRNILRDHINRNQELKKRMAVTSGISLNTSVDPLEYKTKVSDAIPYLERLNALHGLLESLNDKGLTIKVYDSINLLDANILIEISSIYPNKPTSVKTHTKEAIVYIIRELTRILKNDELIDLVEVLNKQFSSDEGRQAFRNLASFIKGVGDVTSDIDSLLFTDASDKLMGLIDEVTDGDNESAPFTVLREVSKLSFDTKRVDLRMSARDILKDLTNEEVVVSIHNSSNYLSGAVDDLTTSNGNILSTITDIPATLYNLISFLDTTEEVIDVGGMLLNFTESWTNVSPILVDFLKE